MGSNKNSFTESLANFFTPYDDYEYRGGNLYEGDSTDPYEGANTKTNYGTLGQADSSGTGDGQYYQNVTSSGGTRNPNNTTAGLPNVPDAERGTRTSTMQRVIPGLALGAAGFGPLAMGAAMYRGLGSNIYGTPQLDNTQSVTQDQINRAVARTNATKQGTAGTGDGKSFFGGERSSEGYTSDIRREGDKHPRIEGAFFKKDDPSGRAYKINAFGSSYEVDTDGQNIGNSSQIRRDAAAAAAGGDNDGIATVRRPASAATVATAPTSTMPAPSAESIFARQQVVTPPAEWLIANGYPDTNPSYEAIKQYNTDKRAGVASMAEGGDVEFALGGNEKDLLNAMENVVRKDLAGDDEFNPADMSDEDKIVIAQFVQQYGVDAIPRLVKKIQDGSIDETRERFASGENGEVRGNGDGSGVDDMVTAQLKDGDATQDVLLADGEFVLRKDAYESLKDAGVNVDKVNDAGPDAATTLKKYMTA